MTGKRQHYIPAFLQRRFAIDPLDRTRILRLAIATGQTQTIGIKSSAVKKHYYRIFHEDGTVDDSADAVLDRIESDAAPVIARLSESGMRPSIRDINKLALFITSLKLRTPEGREQLRESDRIAGKMWLEVRLSDAEDYARVMARRGLSEAELEAERLAALDDLRKGRISIDSSPSREVAAMFMALETTTQALVHKLGWTLVRAPMRHSFVLSDHPVLHHDPTPKFDGAGAGYLSSDNSMTVIPLDPEFVLILEPHNPQTWCEAVASPRDVKNLNLMTYAQATASIMGHSQEAVTRVRMFARRSRKRLAEFAKRPPRIWISKVSEGDDGSGVQSFTSDYQGHTISRALYVTPDGAAKARRNAT